MVGMFEELIEFSRGEQELKLETVDIRRMLERFRELNVLYFQDDKIAVDISVPDIEIDAEERKLLRVLQNLVGNAFDDEEGKITIAGELEGKRYLASPGSGQRKWHTRRNPGSILRGICDLREEQRHRPG